MEGPNIQLGIKYLALLCYQNDHWFAMVLEKQKYQIFVLDSCLSGPVRFEFLRIIII